MEAAAITRARRPREERNGGDEGNEGNDVDEREEIDEVDERRCCDESDEGNEVDERDEVDDDNDCDGQGEVYQVADEEAVGVGKAGRVREGPSDVAEVEGGGRY